MSLFSELKRRNVVKIGVAYLIVTWLLVQVTDLAAPRLYLPGWVPTFVIFILALGFPVALLLAWAFEVTPDGIRKTVDVPLEKSIRRLTGQKLNYALIALLSIAVVVLLTDRIKGGGSGTAVDSEVADRISIAVLPFDNLSGDPDQEHFVDGLTEELLNSLAAIDDFRVISRTSSFTYKDKDVPVSQIASELSVSHILEGSVRRVGDRIRVTAQLIDTDTDSHLWQENFDRELTVDNILEIQDVVSRTVADRLEVRLTSVEYRSSVPSSLAALDHYLDGMYYVRRMQLADYEYGDRTFFDGATEAFQKSIAEDPDWSPAHAGLGMVYHFNRHIGDEWDQLRKSREHVERAIQLDNTNGQAHNSLGFINTIEGNYDAAFQSYELARQYYDGYHWGLAILYLRVGLFEDAAAEYREAARKDPLSRSVRGQFANALWCAGDYRELIDVASEVVQIEPNNLGAKAILADGYVEVGDIDNAVRIANEISAIDNSDFRVAYVLAKAGQHDRVRAVLSTEQAAEWWWATAPAAAVLGESDTAIDILEQEVDYRIEEGRLQSLGLGMVRCDPALMKLTGNPRFDALMERLNLPGQ